MVLLVMSPFLKRLKETTQLTYLCLLKNNLGFTGVESLAAALETNTTLTTYLCLLKNNQGAAGAESLAKGLETNTTLKTLVLWHGNEVSESVHKKLYAAHGNCILY